MSRPNRSVPSRLKSNCVVTGIASCTSVHCWLSVRSRTARKPATRTQQARNTEVTRITRLYHFGFVLWLASTVNEVIATTTESPICNFVAAASGLGRVAMIGFGRLAFRCFSRQIVRTLIRPTLLSAAVQAHPHPFVRADKTDLFDARDPDLRNPERMNSLLLKTTSSGRKTIFTQSPVAKLLPIQCRRTVAPHRLPDDRSSPSLRVCSPRRGKWRRTQSPG